jgi:NAD(P)-dependent dehydrogenase (short-subunit alcohol dehydrogenase family)
VSNIKTIRDDPDTKSLNIVLSGATGGVGRAILASLLDRGHRVLAIGNTKARLLDLSNGLKQSQKDLVRTCKADLSTPAGVKQATRSTRAFFIKRVDALINNAGIAFHCPASNINPEEAALVMNLNALGPILLTTQLLPLIRNSRGRIINISSFLGSNILPMTSAYAASKHALNGFSKTLRVEEAPHGVAVTIIEPGAIDTSFIERTHDELAKSQMAKRGLQKLPPAEISRWVLAVIDSPSVSCPELLRIVPIHQAS